MMSARHWLLLLVLPLLAACNSPADIAARKQAQAAKDTAACEKAGHIPGTQPFDACRERLRHLRAERKAAEATADEPVRGGGYRYRY